MPVSVPTVADAEDIVLAWLKTTLPAVKCFLQSEGNPLPRIQLARVGGAPTDIADVARISFTVHAATRPQAKDITKDLVNALLDLAYSGSVSTAKGVLEAVTVLSQLWLPDPVSDTPRYIVDIRAVTRAG